MLRNLNQSFSGKRICGTPKSGVIGSLIPATGDNGPGYAYNDLSLPADNGKEICGRITAWPSAGTLFAYEDTSFEFDAPDGAYSFQYQLYVDGVATGSPATVDLRVGVVTHAATGSLSASAATVSASAALVSGVVTHSASGDIVSGGAAVTGDAARLGGYVTHSASAAIVCSSASVSGVALNGLIAYVRAPSGPGAALIRAGTSRPSQLNTRRY